MLLSHRTSVKIRPEYSNIIGHMCYAASKLWNICNYERHHYKELGLEKYPDWYYQKKTLPAACTSAEQSQIAAYLQQELGMAPILEVQEDTE